MLTFNVNTVLSNTFNNYFLKLKKVYIYNARQ